MACGGPIPSGDKNTAPARPADVARVRLFDSVGTELTLHTGLVDDESLLVEVRLYKADGTRVTDVSGGVTFALEFTPDSLATSSPITGQMLERRVRPTAASGTVGSQTVALHFPGDNSNKSFGPFHVQVQPSVHNGVAQMRLFDPQNAELTQHVPLQSDLTTRIEVRLYDPEGRQLTSVPGGVEIGFRFDPTTLAKADSVAGQPLRKDVTPTAPGGVDGSLFVSVLFLADSVQKTYGPIQVLVH
jgi:hypothetical protein